MTRYTPMYEQLGTYTAVADRMFHGDILGANVSSMLLSYGAFQVTQCGTGANMSVDVQPGRAMLQGNFMANEGAYYLWSDAVENVVIAAAPGAGQERYDVIVAQVRNGFIDGGNNNDFLFTKIQGTAAATGSATVPAIGTNQLKLAQVLVSANVTSILNAKITDFRPVLWNQIQPPPLSGAAPFAYYTDSNNEVWCAKGGVNGGAWRRATEVLHARWHRNAALNSSASNVNIPWDGKEFDDYGLYVSASTGFILPVPGIWRLMGLLTCTTTAVNQVSLIDLWQTSFRKVEHRITAPTASTVSVTAVAVMRCVVGDNLQVGGLTTPGGLAYTVGFAYTTAAECDYLGTG
jgi:hypothetical protein